MKAWHLRKEGVFYPKVTHLWVVCQSANERERERERERAICFGVRIGVGRIRCAG